LRFRGSHKALMQLPSASNDLLIFAPSIKRSPRFFVALARSLPAKSIMLRVAMVWGSLTDALRSFDETLICRTACDRDDVALASVGDMVRYSLPRTIMSITSWTWVSVSSTVRMAPRGTYVLRTMARQARNRDCLIGILPQHERGFAATLDKQITNSLIVDLQIRQGDLCDLLLLNFLDLFEELLHGHEDYTRLL
jgi:hypothetical protein